MGKKLIPNSKDSTNQDWKKVFSTIEYRSTNLIISILSCFLVITIGLLPSIANFHATQISQNTKVTLQNAFGYGSGFAHFEWFRAEDKGKIYSSAIYLSVDKNQLSIFNSYQKEPLGHLSRCGGLGCDLGKGSLVATIEFIHQNKNFLVKNASAKADFLRGATCKVNKKSFSYLECLSTKGPRGNFLSIINFIPGT